MTYEYDAIVVGTGPNGFGAAITLAQAGLNVCMYEARDTVGGGMRTYELTQPGFKHDVCSAIHPMGLASPFMSQLPLREHGLEWIQPTYPLAHPFDDGTAAVLDRSIEMTGYTIGEDAQGYRRLMKPIVDQWERLVPDLVGTYRTIPRALIPFGFFGLKALFPATVLSKIAFDGERGKALFAGIAAHSILPLERPISSSFGLVLGAAGHAVGWPIPKGGSQSIANALASYFESLGGKIVLGHPVNNIDELPRARAYLLNITPRQLMGMAEHKLPTGYKAQMNRFRQGAGVFKIDYAIEGEIPWTAKECAEAGTVHLGGTMAEIAASERTMVKGQHAEKPYVLVAQQGNFDKSRAPEGKNTVWAYCHVPHGSTVDMTDAIERQIERFAPGFKDLIIDKHTMNTTQFQTYNGNYIGGDINGGAQDIFQMFTRPAIKLRNYPVPTTDDSRVYLASSSVPPGGGVHGMGGYHAAKAALYDLRRAGEIR